MILAVDVPREVFQSTHPARGATERGRALSVAVGISIHAPREGCDPRMVRSASQLSLFQSTHPARGATRPPRSGGPGRSDFNPRTPRGVRRAAPGCNSCCSVNFNPRTPRGVRPPRWYNPPHRPVISIHAPREGCDDATHHVLCYSNDFNPRTPRGVRRPGAVQ